MSSNDFGFKVSLPSIDVKKATPEECTIHSSYPPLKAKLDQNPPHFAQLSVTFTAAVPQNTVITVFSMNHGYGYTPATFPNLTFLDVSGINYAGIGEISVGATLAITAYATSTDFIVELYDNAFFTGSTANMQVSYYIFAENGA